MITFLSVVGVMIRCQWFLSSRTERSRWKPCSLHPPSHSGWVKTLSHLLSRTPSSPNSLFPSVAHLPRISLVADALHGWFSHCRSRICLSKHKHHRNSHRGKKKKKHPHSTLLKIKPITWRVHVIMGKQRGRGLRQALKWCNCGKVIMCWSSSSPVCFIVKSNSTYQWRMNSPVVYL